MTTARSSSYLTGLVFNFTGSFLSYMQFATIQRQPAAYPHQLFDEFDGPRVLGVVTRYFERVIQLAGVLASHQWGPALREVHLREPCDVLR